MVNCFECGNVISSNAESCPHCGNPMARPGSVLLPPPPVHTVHVKKQRPSGYKWATWMVCLLCVVPVVAVWIMSSEPADTATPIPKDVTYTIIRKNIVPGIKRSLDIRLNRRVSQSVLKSIAMKLKNSDPKPYVRTFIGYYLPDMKLNSVYWATTHFDPNLEVRILGLTAEHEKALLQQPADPSREIIGIWLDERPFFGSRVTIFRKNGKLFMENKYGDGSAGTAELSETRSQRGRRFDYKPDRGNGEYYLINDKGELEELDRDGVFTTARKIN